MLKAIGMYILQAIVIFIIWGIFEYIVSELHYRSIMSKGYKDDNRHLY